MIKLFRTEQGSEYFLERDRTCTRRRVGGEEIFGFLYIGSVDRSQNPDLYQDGTHFDYDLFVQILDRDIPGYSPDLKIGNDPLGIRLKDPTHFSFRDGMYEFFDHTDFNRSQLHVGHPIVEVYEPELAQNGRWLTD